MHLHNVVPSVVYCKTGYDSLPNGLRITCGEPSAARRSRQVDARVSPHKLFHDAQDYLYHKP
ncbi:hypothetical protein CLDAP_21230 [Caldilinea aerophila DSM 14535 = NBRC 104270]|uniref:Uncharacterized protein n=1 Tax=Caldilinea aerophila (strain DSM 14535 / JCM 11387 / NBRC 104270 / STL-6-O1) TaxID=926550 RepID=I0I4H5_CALAS|nr:hypothetical protein CLDAP_21230 [Caldilinea aerophila DSM 14535 = NBRC 104270]